MLYILKTIYLDESNQNYRRVKKQSYVIKLLNTYNIVGCRGIKLEYSPHSQCTVGENLRGGTSSLVAKLSCHSYITYVYS